MLPLQFPIHFHVKLKSLAKMLCIFERMQSITSIHILEKTAFNLHFKQIKKGGQVSSKKNLSTWKKWTKILIVRYEIISEIPSTLGSSQNVTFTGSQINEAWIESLETLLTWIMTYIDINCSLHVTIYQHFTISVFLNRESAHNGSRCYAMVTSYLEDNASLHFVWKTLAISPTNINTPKTGSIT